MSLWAAKSGGARPFGLQLGRLWACGVSWALDAPGLRLALSSQGHRGQQAPALEAGLCSMGWLQGRDAGHPLTCLHSAPHCLSPVAWQLEVELKFNSALKVKPRGFT